MAIRKFIPLLALPGLCVMLVSCTKSALRSSSSRVTGGTSVEMRKSAYQVEEMRSGERRRVRTTAYSHKENEPGAHGRLSAAGNTLRYGRVRSAAADWSRFPLGTQFRIVGERHLYEIDDYGTALVGTWTVDLYKPNLRLMKEWGSRHVEIEIVRWGSFERSAELLGKRLQYPQCREMYRCIRSSRG